MELGKVENLWVDIRSTSMTGPGLMKITNLARERLKTKTENVKLFSPTLFHSPVSWSRMKEHVGQRWPPVSKICKTNPEPLVKIDRNVKNDTSEAESLAAQPSMDAACKYKGKCKLIVKILINI